MASKYSYFPSADYSKTRVGAQRLREIESEDRAKLDKISEWIELAMKNDSEHLVILPVDLPSDLTDFENTLNSKGYRVTVNRRGGDGGVREVIVGWD